MTFVSRCVATSFLIGLLSTTGPGLASDRPTGSSETAIMTPFDTSKPRPVLTKEAKTLSKITRASAIELEKLESMLRSSTLRQEIIELNQMIVAHKIQTRLSLLSVKAGFARERNDERSVAAAEKLIEKYTRRAERLGIQVKTPTKTGEQ